MSRGSKRGNQQARGRSSRSAPSGHPRRPSEGDASSSFQEEVVFSIPSSFPSIPPELAAQFLKEGAAKYLARSDDDVTEDGNGGENARRPFGPPRPPPSERSLEFVASLAQDACSETEMKALMSMFAEFMEMEPGDDRDGRPVMMFGGSRSSTASCNGWQPAGAYQGRDRIDDEEHYDSELEDNDCKQGGAIPSAESACFEQSNQEVLAVEERAKKAAKRREKKQRKKEREKQEADRKAAEAAQKKREKALQSWTSRVLSACQAGDGGKVELLLSESPLLKRNKKGDVVMDGTEHIELLLPSCFCKSPDQVETGREAREKLTSFVLETQPGLFFAMRRRTKRNALHSACYVGDHYFVRQVMNFISKSNDFTADELDITCSESGWAAIHYAVGSGSPEVVGALLEGGCNVRCLTDAQLTWSQSDQGGITAYDIAEGIQSNNLCDFFQSKGSVFKELGERTRGKSQERRKFMACMKAIAARLSDVVINGYTPLVAESKMDPKLLHSESRALSTDGATKKKKKKPQQTERAPQKSPTPDKSNVSSSGREDPVVAAVLGMGFAREQVDDAFAACGGTARATADDMVVWILEQQSGRESSSEENRIEPTSNTEKGRQGESDQSSSFSGGDGNFKSAEETDSIDSKKREEEARLAAERLAAKREEQRRRNREWNSREQARQNNEARVKLQQALALRARADAHRMALRQTAEAAQQRPRVTLTSNPENPTAYLSGDSSAISSRQTESVPLMEQTVHVPQDSDRCSIGRTLVMGNQSCMTKIDKNFKLETPLENREVMVSSQPHFTTSAQEHPQSKPPPGFQLQGSQLLSGDKLHVRGVDVSTDNALGEIRATAKEFVPSNFASSFGGAASGNVSSLDLVEGSPVLAPSLFGESPPEKDLIHTASFDRPGNVMPASPVPSTVSSLTGTSAFEEFPPVPLSIGFGSSGQVKSESGPATVATSTSTSSIWGNSINASMAPGDGLSSLGVLGETNASHDSSDSGIFALTGNNRTVSDGWRSGAVGGSNVLSSIW